MSSYKDGETVDMEPTSIQEFAQEIGHALRTPTAALSHLVSAMDDNAKHKAMFDKVIKRLRKVYQRCEQYR